MPFLPERWPSLIPAHGHGANELLRQTAEHPGGASKAMVWVFVYFILSLAMSGQHGKGKKQSYLK